MERRYGTIRSDRSIKDLLNSPFRIDDRSSWEIMGYISSFLEKINFYNLDNDISGPWSKVIENDPMVYMVSIINTPLTELEDLLNKFQSGGLKDQKQAIKILLKWYERVSKWELTLNLFQEYRLSNRIKDMLSDILLSQYTKLEAMLSSKSPIPTRKPTRFKSPPDENDDSLQSLVGPDDDFDKIIHSFQKAVLFVQTITKDHLEQRFFEDNHHDPASAMYLSFVVLYRRVQAALNEMSRKHLDFYYKEIIQQKQGMGRPTRAIVNFELLPNESYLNIDKGLKLSAGQLFGAQSDLIFSLAKGLTAYQVKLVELQTLLFNSSRYIKVGTDEPTISSILRNSLIVNSKDQSSRDSWYVFGANKQSVQNTLVDETRKVDIGFVIGSPVLFLSEGRRKIDIRFYFEQTTAKNVFWNLIQQIESNEKLELDAVFHQVFENSLKLSYSTKKGWELFNDFEVSYNKSENYITLHLVLESGDPSLDLNPLVHQTYKWPSINVELNEYAPCYLYSFFRGVELDAIEIDVDVTRVKDLSIYNNIGKMPPGSTFYAFGPTPKDGDELLIGKDELFKKNLRSIDFQIDWEAVPTDFGGFDVYYENYSEPITNESFSLTINALTDGNWLPSKPYAAPKIPMFNTEKCLTPEGYESNRLTNTTSVELNDLDVFEIHPDENIKSPLVYDIHSQSGFFRFTFIGGKNAFGVELYQKDYVDIVTYNAKHKANLPIPNKPFIPKVKEISLNYSASDVLSFTTEQTINKTSQSEQNYGEFYHITPFGIEDILKDQTFKTRTLLCDYEQEGYLIMGLDGIQEELTLSVYFLFLQSSSGTQIDSQKLRWEYYNQNRWVPLEEGNILSDGTSGFIKSGIIEFNLPPVEGVGEPGGQKHYWLRVSVKDRSEIYPRLTGIYFNAIEVVCDTEESDVIGKVVPAGKIKEPTTKLPGLKAIQQMAASYGGKQVTNSGEFYDRVSERLRHKDRSVSVWDHERLILENFDSVRVVKCTNLDKRFEPEAGQVKVIVLSEMWTNEERHYFNRNELSMMQSFLEKRSSSFADIQVMNPIPEYLFVKCIIEFEPEFNGGFYQNMLNDDISDYLSPISGIDNGIGGIGGYVIPTMLVSYLENKEYICSVSNLAVEHIVRKGENNYSLGSYRKSEVIKTTTPWSILLPVEQHLIINANNPEAKGSELDIGISNMEIGLDFIISKDDQQSQVQQDNSNKIQISDPESYTKDSLLVFRTKSKKI